MSEKNQYTINISENDLMELKLLRAVLLKQETEAALLSRKQGAMMRTSETENNAQHGREVLDHILKQLP